MTFDEIDARRRALGLPVYSFCKRAGVDYSTYHRISRGSPCPRPTTLARLAAALSAAPRPPRTAPSQANLISTVYRGGVAYVALQFGADEEKVLASVPSRRANSDPQWALAAKVRAIAVYCVSVELDVRGATLASAIGLTRQAVSVMLKRVEDMRDDPAIDALVEKAGKVISGRAA